MKHYSIFLLLVLCHSFIKAQSFQVPSEVIMVSPQDYEEQEQNIVQTVDWLLSTSVNGDVESVKKAKKFIYDWVIGSPKFEFKINPEIVNFLSSSPNLLMIYKGGWAKYAIENQDFVNEYEGSKAGIEAVLKFYLNNKDYLKNDKHIEQLINMQNSGQLDQLIRQHVYLKEQN